jgi:formate hydrogenlyase subunit 6/NADH:ubiquinone oxidoreductase subunit I
MSPLPVLRLLSLALGRGVATVDWPREAMAPDGPPSGFPLFDVGPCTLCGDCIKACPSRCVSLVEGSVSPIVDAGVCIRCGLCVEACSEGAVTLTGDGILAVYSRLDLVMDGDPPEEFTIGPPPSRIFRMAVDGRARVSVDSRRLLEDRSSALLRGGRGSGKD